VIVRISTESQYRLPEDAADELNELDNQVVEAVEAGDEDRFHELFEQLIDLVRRAGQPLEEDALEESDVIIPPPDTSFVEAAEGFTGEGLIPD
jgi:DNA-binding GntR family transcriptional regulator